MSGLIHGRATIRVNGEKLIAEHNAGLEPGGVINDGRMTGDTFGYTQSIDSAVVTCKVRVTKDVSIIRLQSLADVEITFESDTGTSYIIRNAAQTNKLKLEGGEGNGTVELILKGEPAAEVTR